MKKFTFKIHYPTGRFRSFDHIYCDIKLENVLVGSIQEINMNTFQIGFMIIKKDIMEDNNPNVEWKWVWLKWKPKSIKEAKDFILTNSKLFQERFNFRQKE